MQMVKKPKRLLSIQLHSRNLRKTGQQAQHEWSVYILKPYSNDLEVFEDQARGHS